MGIKKLLLIIALSHLGLCVIHPGVKAETLSVVVEGNGSGSDNAASTTSSTEVSVDQQNVSETSTTINLTASTGDNSANGNGDEVEITTGDIETAAQVSTNTNNNSATIGCCATANTQATIAGNGADTTNVAHTSSTNVMTLSSNNTATTANTFTISANTGGNTAHNNHGKVLIQTGDIETLVKVTTLANISRFSYLNCCTSPEGDTFKIKGNGAGSQNSLTYHTSDVLGITQHNHSVLDNLIFLALNTGNNTADGNSGDVSILTGDITTLVSIKNQTNINEAVIDLCCDDDDTPPEEPEEPVTPPNPPGKGGGSIDTTDHNSAGSTSSSGNGSTSESGKGLKDLLPATGGNYLIYMLIANLLMFWLGCYLRLRSGRAPALATC